MIMDMDKNNKNLWISAAVIVLVIAGLIYWSIANDNSPEEELTQNTSPTGEVESTEDTSEGSVNTRASFGAATLSYQKALIQYEGARLQLDTTCQGTPDNMTFKNGTNIMIDNRSPHSRTVRVGSTFSIKPWGFKIVKLSSSILPATWLVDCDQSQNVATILIQK